MTFYNESKTGGKGRDNDDSYLLPRLPSGPHLLGREETRRTRGKKKKKEGNQTKKRKGSARHGTPQKRAKGTRRNLMSSIKAASRGFYALPNNEKGQITPGGKEGEAGHKRSRDSARKQQLEKNPAARCTSTGNGK